MEGMYEFAWKRIRITAAERRESVAPGASPGLYAVKGVSTGGAKDFKDSFAPTGLEIQNDTYPGLAPGATLWRRSAAVIRTCTAAQAESAALEYSPPHTHHEMNFVCFVAIPAIIQSRKPGILRRSPVRKTPEPPDCACPK